jgi:hypothetical protein
MSLFSAYFFALVLTVDVDGPPAQAHASDANVLPLRR